MDMKGLSVFIADLRKANSKEAEQKRVDKEMAKIRMKFKSNANMKGYDRKKYVCKLLYIYMLGYEIDFGHMEAVALLSSDKYSEKHIGYLACTLFLNEGHELLTLITNSIKQDLVNKNMENHQCLALTAIANVGGKDFAEVLAQDVQKILVAGETKSIVRKKAALCLLRLYRKYPEILPPDSWSERVINLLGGRDLGVITSVMALLVELSSASPAEYEKAVPKVVRLLHKIVVNREYTNDYIYYGIPSPWVQVKLLRLLQLYPAPDAELLQQITQVIGKIISGAERIRNMDSKTKSVSRNNAVHSVLFEALKLAIHYDTDRELLVTAANILGRFLSDKDTNLKYLSLDTMSRLAQASSGEIVEHIKKHQETILLALKDPDISIRKRALDLLYSMCDKSNASQIVGELLAYLTIADFAIREELVLKIAILSEKFAADLTWYVDVILNLIAQAGDFVSDDIWYRVVQIVTNSDEELQRYAADTVLKAVTSPAAHENAVKVAGYILGEFGHLISDNESSNPAAQFSALNNKFNLSSSQTKALLLTAYIKFYNMYEDAEVRKKIIGVFQKFRGFIDAEIQQRANEYFMLASNSDEALMQAVLEAMPNFPERESSLVNYLKARRGEAAGGQGKDKQQQGEDGEEDDESANQRQFQPPQPAVAQPKAETMIDLDFPGSSNNASSQQQQQQQQAVSLDDFIGGSSSQPQPTPAPVQQKPQPQQSVDDIFGSMTSPEPTPQQQQSPTPQQPPLASLLAQETANIAARKHYDANVDQMVGRVSQEELQKQIEAIQADAAKRFVKLVVGDSGVALEDPRLQLGIKSEFHGSQGRIVMYFGNKQQAPLVQVRSSVDNVAELKLQLSQVSPIVAPKTQIQQYINVECMDPFEKEVSLSLYFEYERQPYKFTVTLPIVINKFIEPLRLGSAEEFFKRWNAIQANSQLESIKTFKSPKPIDIKWLDNLLSTGFKLAVLNVDPNPANMVTAGIVCTKNGQHSVLVRLQTNTAAQAYKLTVRSSNEIVTRTISNLIEQQLLQE